MSTLLRNIFLYGPPLLLWALLLLTAARRGARPVLYAPATQAVPSGPLLLVTLDARAPRGAAFRALMDGDALPSSEELTRACGEDPLAGAAEVALAMPAAAAEGEFGLVIAGELREEPLVRCASRVILARGGRPVALREGAFSMVTDVASAGEGVVAVREGGPLLLGGLPYVRRMVAASAGREPSVEVDARHVALRAEAGEGVLVASALLSADLRERLQAEVGAAEKTPLAGVLGLGLSLGPLDPVAGRLVVGCDSERACAGVQGLLRTMQEEGGPGWKGALAGAEVEQRGPTVRLRAALPAPLLGVFSRAVRSRLRGP